MRQLQVTTFCVLVTFVGCTTERPPQAHVPKETRPALAPSPASGELFEGQIRVHTRGTQGDALGCAVSPLGDLIAFSWNNHHEEPKIYVVATRGGPPRQVTFGPWPDINPAFRPEDDPGAYQLAFASRREGNFDIYLVPLAGNTPAWQVTADPADEVHPSFSPDGTSLLFSRLDRDGVWRIWRKDLRTQQEILLGPGANPEWSPEGEHIAFQLVTGRNRKLWSIWVMKADGTARTEVFASEDTWGVHPAWSPDGRFLTFSKVRPRKEAPENVPAGDIWVYDRKTGMSFRLTGTASLDADPCWSVDGWIYFSSTRTTGTFNILSGRVQSQLAKPGLAESVLENEP